MNPRHFDAQAEPEAGGDRLWMRLDGPSFLTRTMAAMSMPEFVSVDGAPTRAGAGAYERALPPTGDTANRGAGCRCSRDRQLIAMLLPERPAMAMTSHLRRRSGRRQTKCCENQKNHQKLFHYSPPDIARGIPAGES